MKTYLVQVTLTQYFEQRIEADDPAEAQQKTVEAAATGEAPEPVKLTFESKTTPLELAYEG